MVIATRTTTSRRSGLSRRRVHLLVGDNDTRDLYRIYLQTVGMEVETAADGESAAEIARSGLPDVSCSTSACPAWTAAKRSVISAAQANGADPGHPVDQRRHWPPERGACSGPTPP